MSAQEVFNFIYDHLKRFKGERVTPMLNDEMKLIVIQCLDRLRQEKKMCQVIRPEFSVAQSIDDPTRVDLVPMNAEAQAMCLEVWRGESNQNLEGRRGEQEDHGGDGGEGEDS